MICIFIQVIWAGIHTNDITSIIVRGITPVAQVSNASHDHVDQGGASGK